MLCENCDRQLGYYKSSAYHCSSCGAFWKTWTLFILSFLFQLLIMLYQCYSHFDQQQSEKVVKCLKIGWGYYLVGENTITHILKQLIFHFQVMGLIATFQPLPISLQDVLASLFSSHLIVSRSVLCIIDLHSLGLPSSLTTEIINSLVILLQYLLLLSVVGVLMFRGTATGYSLRTKFTVCTFILMSFTCSSSLSTAVQFMSTRTVLGERYSGLDLSIQKDSQTYRLFLYLYSLPSAVLWAVLFPSSIAFILFSLRGRMTARHFSERYLFLIREYTQRGHFWEFCKVIYICLLTIGISLFNNEFYLQSSLVCIMVVAFNILQYAVSPFRSLVTQRIFAICSNIQLITLLYGISSRPVFSGFSGEGDGLSQEVKIALYTYFVVLVGIHLALIIYILMREYPQIIRVLSILSLRAEMQLGIRCTGMFRMYYRR